MKLLLKNGLLRMSIVNWLIFSVASMKARRSLRMSLAFYIQFLMHL